MIVKNVNANIPVSLSWLLLPFLALLCFAATAQFTDSSLYWPNGLIQFLCKARLPSFAALRFSSGAAGKIRCAESHNEIRFF